MSTSDHIFGICLIVFLGAYLIGSVQAVRQDRFYVALSATELVVLRIYGDRMIAASFDRQKREIGQEYHIVPLDADPPALTFEVLGRLKRRKVSPAKGPIN